MSKVFRLTPSPSAGKTFRIGPPTSPPISPIQVLPTLVAAAVSKADGNTSQWQSFKSRLDSNLAGYTDEAYQGLHLPIIADFALGYYCLKNSAPSTAASYADKALALMRQVSTDYLTGNTQSGWLYIARGTGSQTAFTLPNAPNAGTTQARFGAISTISVTRGSGATDTINSDNYRIIKVSNTNDGPADYAEGTDWTQNGLYHIQFINWNNGGSAPATSATYYVTVVSHYSVTIPTFNVSGTTLNITSTAPSTSQGVIAKYQFNTYDQTANGMGGWNSILVDSGYTARVFIPVVMAFDWLYDYSGFDSGLKSTYAALFVKWDQWLKNNSLSGVSPTQPSGTALAYKPTGADGIQSNYTVSYYALRAAIACALDGRDAEASTIQTDILAYRTSYAQRDLRDNQGVGTYSSYKGGWWVEGWPDYGGRAMSAMLTGHLLYDFGLIANMDLEAAWADEVIQCVVHTLTGTNKCYPGGDFGVYPAVPTQRENVKIPQVVAATSTYKEWARYFAANIGLSGTDKSDCFDLLYRDPNATATNWTGTAPLYYYAEGSGLVCSRAAWDYASAVMFLECGNQALAGHNTYSPGILTLVRGADDLVIQATEYNGSESAANKLLHGNVVMIGTAGMNTQNFGTHDTFIEAFGATADYTYAECDYLNAFFGLSVVPTELSRAVLHVRPDYIFVYDRAATTLDATAKQLQWYLSNTINRSGDAWDITKGSSDLYAKTFSSTGITSANDTPSVAGVNTPRVTVNPTANTTRICYATILQTAASAATTMDATAFITDGGGTKFEGILIGQVLALFGKSVTGTGATGYVQDTSGGVSYTFTAPGGTVTHYITDLTPNQQYTLSGDASGTPTASAAGVLTFTTTGTGSKTVTIT